MSTANGNTDLGLCPSGQSVHILLDLDAFILKKTIYIYISIRNSSAHAQMCFGISLLGPSPPPELQPNSAAPGGFKGAGLDRAAVPVPTRLSAN